MITVTMISIVAALSHTLPPDERSRGLALFGVLGQFGAMAGVSLAELLLDTRGFSSMLLFTSAALIAAGLSALLFPEQRPSAAEKPPGLRDFAKLIRQRNLRGLLFLSLLLGAGFGTMLSFLPDMALERQVGVVKPYYIAYPAMVIAVRLIASHWFRRIPLVPLIGFPMLMMPVALIIVSGLSSAAGLVAAGLSYGIAHGVLFPVLQAELINRAEEGFRARMALVFQFLFNARHLPGGEPGRTSGRPFTALNLHSDGGHHRQRHTGFYGSASPETPGTVRVNQPPMPMRAAAAMERTSPDTRMALSLSPMTARWSSTVGAGYRAVRITAEIR
jgi:hypothetical protein